MTDNELLVIETIGKLGGRKGHVTYQFVEEETKLERFELDKILKVLYERKLLKEVQFLGNDRTIPTMFKLR